MTFFAGDVLNAADLNALPKGIIAQYPRGAGSISGVTTETGFIRMDNIAVRAGYTYEVVASRVILTTSLAATSATARLRGSTSGTATTSSTQLDGGEIRGTASPDTSNVPELTMIGYFDASASGSLSVILTVLRAQGSGTVGLFSSTGRMVVKEIGLTPTNSGTDL